MPIEPDKIDAAVEHIDWAARLFIEHSAYRAATTLAGAADELLGKSVQGQPAFELLRDHLAAISGEDAKDIGRRLNQPRNWLKHGGLAPDKPDWAHFAATEIMRAAKNLMLHGHRLPTSVIPVMGWVQANTDPD